MVDGKIIAAAEEERFIREKHAEGKTPLHATRFCLSEAGLTPKDVDIVAYAFSPELYHELKWKYFKRTWRTQPQAAYKTLLQTDKIIERRTRHFKQFLIDSGLKEAGCPVEYVEHHLAHASSAYHLSDFTDSDAALLTVDGVGELTCTLVARGLSGRIEKIEEMLIPDSIGLFYSTITEFLGFKTTDGEFKVMGMSAYGEPGKVDLSNLIRYENKYAKVNENYVWVKKELSHQGKVYSKDLLDLLGPSRTDEGLSEPYVSVAAEAQYQLEQITLKIIDDYLSDELKKHGTLCFAGGCALNVRLNRKILAHPLVKNLIVPSGAHDAGLSAGAASYVAKQKGQQTDALHHAYLGPSYTDEEILEALKKSKIPYEFCEDPCQTGANLLAEGKILSWFQGRMEFGPRALGNRSILAHPAYEGISDQINERIKFREIWRPFCPSILEEHAADILNSDHPAPFMNLSFEVAENYRKTIPEVVHVDGSARAQTVSKKTNPTYHRLISLFKEKTDIPVLLNTSLNRRGEPIVNTPQDAISMFYGCGLDYLMMGSYLIKKRND